MALSSSRIIGLHKQGVIQISPFEEKRAKGASYDVGLGEYYYRMSKESGHDNVADVYDEHYGRRLWGKVQRAMPLVHACQFEFESGGREILRRFERSGTINPQEKVIWLHPKETILTHTNEFIKTDTSLVCEIRGRSTVRRSGLTVSADGNWGDPGYSGRWTLFVENHTQYYIPLVVGRRIAQVIFSKVQGDAVSYRNDREGGKYAVGDSLADTVRNWKPDSFLPRMFKDREIGTYVEGESLLPFVFA